MYNKCIYRLKFLLIFFSFFFILIWYTIHKWTSLWLLNTSCTRSFFLVFVNITAAIYNSNWTSTIHRTQCFFFFFFFFRQMHHYFSFFKILYSSNEKHMLFSSCNSLGGTATMFFDAAGSRQCLGCVGRTQRLVNITVVHDMK